MALNCPEKCDLYYTQEVILFQSDFDHPKQIKNLASESWNAAVLSFDEKTKIRCHKGTKINRFGDGNLFTAIENVDIPAV